MASPERPELHTLVIRKLHSDQLSDELRDALSIRLFDQPCDACADLLPRVPTAHPRSTPALAADRGREHAERRTRADRIPAPGPDLDVITALDARSDELVPQSRIADSCGRRDDHGLRSGL